MTKEHEFENEQTEGSQVEVGAPPAAESEDALTRLSNQLVEERKRADEYLRDMQRIQADFINYKRRAEQEKEEQRKFANAMLILRILPVLDDLERAVETVSAQLAGLHWVQGIFLIERKLRKILEEEGLTKIEALGQTFDPRFHEAIIYEETDEHEEGKVIAVLQNGYMMHNRVIRPAVVKVAGTSNRLKVDD
ncbi:MAG: nucleotide exchange factor GrpE [Chloroflexi bacterium]|nr:nucleotide exchange factor GrpE [Chloroflexota bacterium]MCL5074382.1 nucleotide exchange factor GrpE [Chloroflexota bacterium]